jgi:hypothetical protein
MMSACVMLFPDYGGHSKTLGIANATELDTPEIGRCERRRLDYPLWVALDKCLNACLARL